MTTIILGAPSPTGPLEELADRLRQSGAPGSRTGQDRDGARASLTDRKDGNLEVVAVPGMGWPAGKGRVRRGVRPFHDKAEPP